MNATHYMGLCSVEKAESLAIMSNPTLIEFARGFYSGVPYAQEHRAAMNMAGIIEALADELEAALKRIERIDESPCQCEARRLEALDRENARLFCDRQAAEEVCE